MSKRHYTILVVPSNGSRVRRLKLPSPILGLAVTLGAVGLMLFSAGLYTSIADHFRLARERSERTRLEAQSKTQEDQIKLFTTRVQDLESRLKEMQVLGRKLRGMANLREQREFVAPKPRFSIGGTDLEEDRWELDFYKLEDEIAGELESDLDQLALETALQEQSLKELNQSLLEKSIRSAHTPSIWPTRGLVTSYFGNRINPVTRSYQFHSGVDIATRRGTPVYAAADGVVVFSGRSGGLGKLVIVSHGDGLKTRYAHLSEAYVAPGLQVTRGTKIGAVGTTGRATGPHLHYEVVRNGVPVNPRNFIAD